MKINKYFVYAGNYPEVASDRVSQCVGLLVCFLLVLAESRAVAPEVRTFVLAGQSNMDGRAFAKLLPTELQRPQKDVMFFWKEAWTVLEPGSTFRTGSRPEVRFGPEITFGRDMADAWPADQVAIIKHAKGGTSLIVDWKPRSGPHYVILMDKVNNARRLLSDRGQRLKIEGVVWMQGELDAKDWGIASAYEKNLIGFIAAIRQDLGDSDLPFVFGQIHAPTEFYRFRELVKEAQARVARSSRRVSMVTTSHLELMDDVHYTAPGAMFLGRQFAIETRKLLKTQSGSAP